MSHSKYTHSQAAILEAVETLASIADLDNPTEDLVIQPLEIYGKKIAPRSIDWLKEGEISASIERIRDIFKLVLGYLRKVSRAEGNPPSLRPESMEGIKTLMAVVGKAANKLDEYTHLFQQGSIQSITNLKEYQKLQEFYQKKVQKRLPKGALSKWITEVSQKVMAEQIAIPVQQPLRLEESHVFVDLDLVKRDTDYELFFLHKGNGKRFFSTQLVRNMELVCDFGGKLPEERKSDPLKELPIWRDLIFQTAGAGILQAVQKPSERFYRDAGQFKNNSLVIILKKVLMALMLSSKEQHLVLNEPTKTCSDYFGDFQRYLRETLQNRDYQRYVAYPHKTGGHWSYSAVALVHALCEALFIVGRGHLQMVDVIHNITEQAHNHISPQGSQRSKEGTSSPVCKQIARDFNQISKLMRYHPDGPIHLIWNALQKNKTSSFDPLISNNIPSYLFDVAIGGTQFRMTRMPSPIVQDNITKAAIIDEFKAYLRALIKQRQKEEIEATHLIFNLQDRTAWKEYARCHALEELQNHVDFVSSLVVVTIPMDTDFYYQLPPYHQENHASAFIEQLVAHVVDEGTGFYLPPMLREVLTDSTLSEIANSIHTLFFSGKNVLTVEQRCDFIELFDLFLMLKVVELVGPQSVSIICKDSVDIGNVMTGFILAFLELMEKGSIEHELPFLEMILFAPALLIRERMVQPERLTRMLTALKLVEALCIEKGHDKFRQLLLTHFGPSVDGKVILK